MNFIHLSNINYFPLTAIGQFIEQCINYLTYRQKQYIEIYLYSGSRTIGPRLKS